MLKIKTLKPIRNKKLIDYIHSHKEFESTVGECLGYTSSWFITLLNHKKFNKQDSATVKKVVDSLYKRKRKENHK